VALDPDSSLAQAHELASKIESRVRHGCAGISELIVHTEP
jgi:divalent metal cation (Fe/Co/Zn/Cd) transporter